MTQEVTMTIEARKAELTKQFAAAGAAGDWKAVAKLAREIATIVAGEEKVEQDTRRAALVAVNDKVKVAIDKLLKGMVDKEELDLADGIWYTWDFGTTESTIRLLKTESKRTSPTSGGTGKKYDISTEELLQLHGDEMMPGSDLTWKQAHDEHTEGNKRYIVRMKMIKHFGIAPSS